MKQEPEIPDDAGFAVSRLGELRQAMSKIDTPLHVEQAVTAAFRQGISARRARSLGWLHRAALAAAIVGVAAPAVLWRGVWTIPAAPPAFTASMAPPTLAKAPAPAVRSSPVARIRAPRRTRVPARPVTPVAAAEEVASGFLPLPFAPPLLPNDGGQVIRVRLPRSAMRTVGLPVNEDQFAERIPADVFLGEDGIARAVRFVRVAR